MTVTARALREIWGKTNKGVS